MTPSPQVTRLDVTRALETFLAAGMVWSANAVDDVQAITDAYYYALEDFTVDQLDRAVRHIIRDTREQAKPWIPAANKIRLVIEEMQRPPAPVPTRGAAMTSVTCANAVDALGPVVRDYPEGMQGDRPAVATLRCPAPNCGCEPVSVWLQAGAFGGETGGWGSRYVWSHVALEQQMKRVQDGLPEGLRFRGHR